MVITGNDNQLTRVHGDKYSARPDKVNLATFKHESCVSGRQSAQYREDLLCDHRQYLNVDAIELIKATPGTSL